MTIPSGTGWPPGSEDAIGQTAEFLVWAALIEQSAGGRVDSSSLGNEHSRVGCPADLQPDPTASVLYDSALRGERRFIGEIKVHRQQPVYQPRQTLIEPRFGLSRPEPAPGCRERVNHKQMMSRHRLTNSEAASTSSAGIPNPAIVGGDAEA